jgi:hypothetical protein
MIDDNNPYTNGKIYKITNADKSKCYIGSTCLTLRERLNRHKSHYNNPQYQGGCSVYKLVDEFGVSNCHFELLEDYPCKSKKELLERDKFHYENNDCINMQSPCRSKEEQKAYKKKWAQENAERVKAKKARGIRIIKKCVTSIQHRPCI